MDICLDPFKKYVKSWKMQSVGTKKQGFYCTSVDMQHNTAASAHITFIKQVYSVL